MPVVRKYVYCGKSMIRSTYEMAIHGEHYGCYDYAYFLVGHVEFNLKS